MRGAGHAIYVDSAYRHSDHLEVVVRTVLPGPRCGVTAALTQPVDAPRLPRSELPVRYRTRSETFTCD